LTNLVEIAEKVVDPLCASREQLCRVAQSMSESESCLSVLCEAELNAVVGNLCKVLVSAAECPGRLPPSLASCAAACARAVASILRRGGVVAEHCNLSSSRALSERQDEAMRSVRPALISLFSAIVGSSPGLDLSWIAAAVGPWAGGLADGDARAAVEIVWRVDGQAVAAVPAKGAVWLEAMEAVFAGMRGRQAREALAGVQERMMDLYEDSVLRGRVEALVGSVMIGGDGVRGLVWLLVTGRIVVAGDVGPAAASGPATPPGAPATPPPPPPRARPRPTASAEASSPLRRRPLQAARASPGPPLSPARPEPTGDVVAVDVFAAATTAEDATTDLDNALSLAPPLEGPGTAAAAVVVSRAAVRLALTLLPRCLAFFDGTPSSHRATALAMWALSRQALSPAAADDDGSAQRARSALKVAIAHRPHASALARVPLLCAAAPARARCLPASNPARTALLQSLAEATAIAAINDPHLAAALAADAAEITAMIEPSNDPTDQETLSGLLARIQDQAKTACSEQLQARPVTSHATRLLLL
jgi:hypothetical protein